MRNNPRKSANHRLRFRAFTLLEVVLAVGLASTVVALLAMALDLYLVRVDTNRSRVESAQLARALMNQIADDIRAARYWSPNSGRGGGGGSGGGGTSPSGSSTDPNESDGEDSASLPTESAAQVLGIFGTATELRIDRGARWQWERTSREIDPAAAASANELPQTIVYFFNDGETLLANRLAALGVLSDPALPGYAGLYRQTSGTAAWSYQNTATGVSLTDTAQATAELVAPEVLALEFAYFDGVQMLAEWDTSAQGRLPRGVEIRLTMLQEPFELAMAATPQDREAMLRSEENAVDYRLYVRLPNLRPRRTEGPRRGRNDSQQGPQQAGSAQGGGEDTDEN